MTSALRSQGDPALRLALAPETPRAWVLNLDAEAELDARRRYAPTRHLSALVARERRRLLGTLVRPGDVVVTEEELTAGGPAATRAAGLPGLAWCPTPRALGLLAAAGAHAQPAPDLLVLRQVNARPFAAAVRARLAGESFAKDLARDIEETLALLGRPAADGWLVRRTFGAAGRSRRRIAAGRPSEAEQAWLAAGLRRGPLVVEPWVAIVRETTRSAWVTRDGSVCVSPPCFQATTAQGAWVKTERSGLGEVSRADDERLEEAVHAAGAALAAAGYFGPFGVDAFRHRARGAVGTLEVLNPMSEINARFTMDWTTGMGA